MRNTTTFDDSWKFAIICKTDLYNASRHYGFNKHTGVKIVEVDLTLKEAYKLLLELFCETCDTFFLIGASRYHAQGTITVRVPSGQTATG